MSAYSSHSTHEIKLICRECVNDPANIVDDYVTGDCICGDCGLILESHIVDTRPEWRTFTGDDDTGPDPNRCGDGPSSLFNGAQLNTSISFVPGHDAHKLSRAAKNVQGANANKALVEAYAKIEAMSASVGLVRVVVDTAMELYKRAYDSGKVRARKQEAVIAGCMFLACRQCKLARTFSEIMAITTVPKKELGRTFKLLERLFLEDDKGVPPVDRGGTSSGATAQAMIVRLCDALELKYKVRRVAEEMAETVLERETLGARSPVTVAGVIVYTVSALLKDPKTAREIALIVGCSPLTMRAAYKQLWKEREALIDPGWNVDIRRMPRPI